MNEQIGSGCMKPSTVALDNSAVLSGMSEFRPDSHVAQQSRRDKLRFPTNSVPIDSPNHPLVAPQGEPFTEPEAVQSNRIGNCCVVYDPSALFTSEMLNYSSGAQRQNGRLMDSNVDNATFTTDQYSSHPVPCGNFSSSAKVDDPHGHPCYWKGGLSSHGHGCEWAFAGGPGSDSCNHSPSFVGNMISGDGAIIKSGSISNQDVSKLFGHVPVAPSSFYQTIGLRETATAAAAATSSTSALGTQGFGIDSLVHQNFRGNTEPGTCIDESNELVLLPSFENPMAPMQVEWTERLAGTGHRWSNGETIVLNRSERELATFANDNSIQGGLSLSLSSHSPNELQAVQFRDKISSQDLQSGGNLGYYCSKSPVGARGYVNSAQSILGDSVDTCSRAYPLGPFTGYATILRSSKFLKPAQQLLDEVCGVTGTKLAKMSRIFERSSIDMSSAQDTVNVESGMGGRNGSSAASTPSFHSSTDSHEEGQSAIPACEAYFPDFQHKKAKLLYMKEEVCRRYKQYHQQMQLVISSFESVAGLSAATPYSSSALKTVAKHFRLLKNAISDQFLLTATETGNEFVSCSTSKGETMLRLKSIEQGFQKQKNGGSLSFLNQHQQHIWRPQRGLPERAVTILRAWLFEHFLHPYPTDTDKHMLATQTGLSRNQVSNWFINARVRLWKPMVEEIHMLETKGLAVKKDNSVKNDRRLVSDNVEVSTGDQMNNVASNKQSECSTIGSVMNTAEQRNVELWHQEKRVRVEEYHIPSSVDGDLSGFVPYQASIGHGGLGAVSLTLGLRHGIEGMQQQQQQVKMHLDGQMVRNFIR